MVHVLWDYNAVSGDFGVVGVIVLSFGCERSTERGYPEGGTWHFAPEVSSYCFSESEARLRCRVCLYGILQILAGPTRVSRRADHRTINSLGSFQRDTSYLCSIGCIPPPTHQPSPAGSSVDFRDGPSSKVQAPKANGIFCRSSASHAAEA